jgi:hypothetical protein
LPKGKGIAGKEIIGKLKKQRIALSESTLRKHIIPKLKTDYKVENDRSAGGYLIR